MRPLPAQERFCRLCDRHCALPSQSVGAGLIGVGRLPGPRQVLRDNKGITLAQEIPLRSRASRPYPKRHLNGPGQAIMTPSDVGTIREDLTELTAAGRRPSARCTRRHIRPIRTTTCRERPARAAERSRRIGRRARRSRRAGDVGPIRSHRPRREWPYACVSSSHLRQDGCGRCAAVGGSLPGGLPQRFGTHHNSLAVDGQHQHRRGGARLDGPRVIEDVDVLRGADQQASELALGQRRAAPTKNRLPRRIVGDACRFAERQAGQSVRVPAAGQR